MTENTIEFHPLANIFPLLEGQQFRELVEDIRVHGLREPIVLFDGVILDGRNRYRACHAAQVAARFETYRGKDPIAYVVSVNLHRRHLDASQRAMIAAEFAALRIGKGAGRPKKDGRRDQGGRLLPPLKSDRKPFDGERRKAGKYVPADTRISASAAGELLNVSGDSVRLAQHILSKGTAELIQAVKSGEVTVQPAKELARLPKEQQRRIMESGGQAAVAIIGRQARFERLNQRRFNRAAAHETTVAVFDHIKIGDGRSIGNVRIGEAARLAESLLLVADVLLASTKYCANPDHGARIRDVIKETTLSEMIDAARRNRQRSSVA